MGLRNWAIDKLFGREIEAKVKERMTASGLSSPTVEDMQWRRLTTNANRELIPMTQDRMIEIAYWLWETNPLAGWLIDITTAFILAEGLPYETQDEDLKNTLDLFWNDPVNRMNYFFPKHVSELHIFGELCMPAFTAQQTGRVRLGYVDAAQIESVITDPENVKMQIGVLTKRYVGDIGGIHVEQNPKKYRTILPEETDFILSPTAKDLRNQFTDGECFYYSINNVTNSPRGRSSLLSVSDWLDAYEQYLFDYADRWPLMNTFLWDLMVTGADENEIKKQIAAVTKKSGSIFGHNEKITLEAKAPDIKAVQAAEGARMFRNHIMGRFGYPEHWYGGGGDVNRATASEMDLPAIKMLSQKQNFVKYMLEDILGHQVRRAKEAGFLRGGDEKAKFSVITPKMESKNISQLGSMVQQVGTTLLTAEMQGWVDKDTTRKLFATIMGFIGVDINLDEVKKAIEAEKATEGYEDYKDRKSQVAREAQIRQAELEAAQAQVARRQICSPLDGVVVKCYRHAGEWVKPGDPAFHVVRMDRLRIEGFLSESRYAPAQIDGRPVSIEVALSGGRRARFTGKIVFVSPLVQAGGEYRLWAEVLNRQDDQHWLLRPDRVKNQPGVGIDNRGG